MKANETRIEEFLSSNKTQFIIPVYQRNYDWNEAQCRQLWNDILEAGRSSSPHFIGSIVYVHDDVYTSSSIKELVVIDGQQRLTTLTLLYIALYQLARKMNNAELVSEINETYLINKFASEQEKLKLRPTENNDQALKFLLRHDLGETFSGRSKLIDNYNFFAGKLSEANYRAVQKGLGKLVFVEISLDKSKDDPQRIFESLNSTGLALSQADLIRNYILMRLSRENQNRIYRNYWEVIEGLAKAETINQSLVSDFIRDFLTLEMRSIPNKGRVYQEFKTNYPFHNLEELESTLSDIKSLAKYYHRLVNPIHEPDSAIRLHLEYINRLEINVAYPFLMKVYEDYATSVIDKNTFIGVLTLVQSLVWRRFIASLSTNALNKIFMSLYDKIDKTDYFDSVQRALTRLGGKNRFPKDTETLNALKERDVYNIQSKNRMYLLERLENFENREPVTIERNPQITVEHIFPQHPDLKWNRELGAEACERIKDNYLHTIANLTLSGNNGELGNKYFTEKRDLPEAGYRDSRLWLNRQLAQLEKWDEEALENRYEKISERFLKIWPYPSVVDEESGQGEVSIFEAEDPTNKKLDYAILFNDRLEVKEVSKLYAEVFRQLFERQPEPFFTTEIGSRLGLTQQKAELRQAVALNDTYFIEAGHDNIGKFSRIKQALSAFELEDELLIKYSEN